ncbi:DDE-type integrase/transposase/recombinase [Diaphorobacter sp. HDW4B]|uniref:Mu transposase C-terminal domain-containing protein n=1 Tax=Diaphorobacter sp. HDW4B TaxID=2714925 RepID=UPI001408BDDD|nr:Mu transposase C-terminal domain-containing protein [Diaphorobacter sp. HDW4B]QIL71025.1 DDE-type integrase/transposase/recombinase [Diaphorobacter sp. HDW4B]
MNPSFHPGKTIYLNDVPYQVQGHTDDAQLLIRNVESGSVIVKSTNDVLSMYLAGTLKITGTRVTRCAHSRRRADAIRVDTMSSCARQHTDRKIAYSLALRSRLEARISTTKLREEIAKIAASRNEPSSPHVSTIYRWWKEFREADTAGLLSKIGIRGGARKSRLLEEVEAIIQDTVSDALERAHTWSAEDILDQIRHEIEVRNKARVLKDRLIPPCLRTIQRRLAELPQFDVAVAKYGVREAERRYADLGVARKVSRILQLVEIDHTPLDILLVDAEGRVIGRPILTLVLDRFSRCVLGFHLSLDGHGTHSVFAALRHALLPKSYLREGRYAELQLEWNCGGWFERVVMDNGREFHAQATVDALLNLGIVGEFAGSKQPNDKPHVERLLKTINYSFVHRLPGTTLAKQHLRIGFESEDEAVLTIEDIDLALHVWILKKYHRRPNKGLKGKAPYQVWEISAQAFPPQLKCNVVDVDIEFSQRTDSALQHYGIDLNGFRYTSSDLMALRMLLPRNTRVEVKWPRRDVGRIFVWDPVEQRFITAFNTDLEFDRLSLEQAKSVRSKRNKDQYADQVIRAHASAELRDIVSQASECKKLKTRRKGARLSGTNSHSVRPTSATRNTGNSETEIFEVPSSKRYDEFDTFEMEVEGSKA